MMLTRRMLLQQLGGGFGALALTSLLQSNADATPDTVASGGLHHPAKVRRVIQLFMNGGVSQMDTFDYKPELERQHGKQVDFGLKVAVTSTPGPVMKPPFKFSQYGETGRWVSDVLPHMAEHVDELAFLMSMQSKTNVHGPASYMQNTGFLSGGFPALGAWLSYGLGKLTDNLPTFVVLPDHRGLPYNNTGNFSSAFLPAEHGATIIRPNSSTPIANLRPPQSATQITTDSELAGLELIDRLNQAHLVEHAGDSRLEARIKSFELAARMQLSAPDALDITQESASTHKAYGLDQAATEPFGRNCLVARRLIERDVRFVQVWSGMGGPKNNWDNHTDIVNELPFIARSVDQPIGALLTDLKQRGLLDDTLVIWTTEFGRMPFTQGATGRDHNGGTFVTWLTGAGIKAGATYGQSDDFAYRTAEQGTYCYDLHATVLHLMGIDHKRLTFRHNGIDRRLTDVHGHVIDEILNA
ncbi:MAG: DUF1501 domain-containing protein [Planctomycetales bacterium]|nr:DUF1501 domain-containing protein [Planctomycetales bacterium]